MHYKRLLHLFLVAFLFSGLVVACTSGGGQAKTEQVAAEAAGENATKVPEVTFDKLAHDFGPIYSGEKVTYNFRFSNTGKAPLVILNTRSGCGCTVGDYPKEPIPPGGEAKITVQFNSAGRRGFQSESVRVITNATPQEYMLRITAEVIQN
ncbi:MAG: DUF1573 domain-containing protein [Bacteroidales bacterium]|nr:DUF1573 domain-containing protein [Bacteroidales bacterium]